MNLFDISSLVKQLQHLENETNTESFWTDSQNSAKVLKEINQLKSKLESYKKVENNLNNIIEMNDLVEQEKEESLEEELQKAMKHLEKEVEKVEINTLLSEKYDRNNAILTLHPRGRRNRKL